LLYYTMLKSQLGWLNLSHSPTVPPPICRASVTN